MTTTAADKVKIISDYIDTLNEPFCPELGPTRYMSLDTEERVKASLGSLTEEELSEVCKMIDLHKPVLKRSAEKFALLVKAHKGHDTHEYDDERELRELRAEYEQDLIDCYKDHDAVPPFDPNDPYQSKGWEIFDKLLCGEK